MGLNERRVSQTFQNEQFPQLKNQIEEAAGFAVPVEVKWDSISLDGESHLYVESWPKVYFQPLIHAFKAITVDAIGKEALQDRLKKIVVQNSNHCHNATSCVTFQGGTLTIDHLPTTNIDDVADRARAVQTVIEKAL